jgi:mannose/fructose/N-acetylgalactosamine-specific phosphotransferase system component IIB
MIVFTRIDDRLIHGQVVEGWVNYLKATCILVADDAVASNPLQRSIMELSVPQGLKVLIVPVEEMCGQLRTHALDAERTILLFSNPADVMRALKGGMTCAELNIGGMHFVPGKRKLLDVLAVSSVDLDALREIGDKGIKIVVQTVPTQRPVPLEKILALCAPEKSMKG